MRRGEEKEGAGGAAARSKRKMERRRGQRRRGRARRERGPNPSRRCRAHTGRPGPPAGLARPAGEGGGLGGAARSARPRPGRSGAGPGPTALPPPAAPPQGSGRSLPRPDPSSSPAAGRGAWGRGASGSTGLAMALLPGPRWGRPPAGGARRGPGLGGLRPRRTCLPRPFGPSAGLVLLSGLPRPSRPNLHIASRSGCGRTWGRARVPGGGAWLPAGAHNRRAPGRGEGLRRRCLQAWRGLCALRWLSLGDCLKAAEKSAAVPLPVEEVAAAAAEDAHWRSGRSPRCRRPRPRSAPRRHWARGRQGPAPPRPCGDAGRPGPGRGGGAGELLRLCGASSHLGLVFRILNPPPSSCSSCALLGKPRRPVPCPSQGTLPVAGQQFQSRCAQSSRERSSNSDVWLEFKSTHSVSNKPRFRKPIHPQDSLCETHFNTNFVRAAQFAPVRMERATMAQKRKAARSSPQSPEDHLLTCGFLGHPPPHAPSFPALNPNSCY